AFPDSKARQMRFGARTAVHVPLLRDGHPVGLMAVWRTEVQPFTDEQVALLETFADQAVIAIENARLFQELNDSNTSLKEALERQTATAEVLQAISRSAFDLPAVLATLVENAVRLGRADSALIVGVNADGDTYRV